VSHDEVTLASIQSAAEGLVGITQRTPMLSSRYLSALVDGQVLLKAEHLQRGGSFKLRGAYTRISRLDPAARAQGVIAASAGNHAQGVALAASFLGIDATVVMPESASIAKVQATRGYGATVIAHGETIDQSLERAAEIAQERGATLVHPFNHADIVSGQGTAALEILEQCPEVKTILVCTGGGGLLAGIATAVKALRPDVKVIGVQAEMAAAYPPSLEAKKPIALAKMATMADGIAVGRPGDVPFPLVQKYVDEIVTVSEESIAQALLLLLERSKQVVEPAGAVGVAALLQHGSFGPGPTVAMLSGGNVDPLLLLRVIRHGMATVGRYLAINVTIPDRPGSLAALLAQIASLNASVVEIAHERERGDINVDEVDVLVVMETRGAEHCDEIVSTLRASGRPVRLP
jgi:threonine dehydratase